MATTTDTTRCLFFNKLPTEIRAMIWREHIASEPGRIVPIMYKPIVKSYVARTCPPAIFQLNRDCRKEALKIYHEVILGPFCNTGCYVDLTRDTVYLRSFDWLTPQEKRKNTSRLARPAHPANTVNVSKLPEEERSILDDLVNSAGGLHILQDFHVHSQTWGNLSHGLAHTRHELPLSAQPKSIKVVFERGRRTLKCRLKPVVMEDLSSSSNANHKDLMETNMYIEESIDLHKRLNEEEF